MKVRFKLHWITQETSFSSKKLILVVPGELPNDYGSFKDNGTEGPQDSILCQHILLQNLSDCRANARAGPVVLRSLLSGCWVCRDNVVGHPAKASETSKNPGNEAPGDNFFVGEMGTVKAVSGSRFSASNIAAISN